MNAQRRYSKVDFRLDKADRTPEGYLQGVVPVTRCGVFPYRNQDGSVRYELRLPEEVHKPESLDSLKMCPAQVEHVAMLDASNVDQFKVGQLGENYEVGQLPDGVVRIPFRVDGSRGIAAYDAGKRELSMGYILDLEEAPPGSTYLGKTFTHIQRNIRYNHIAITDKARLGSDLRMDSADAVELDSLPISTPQEHPMLKKHVIDGIEYDAAPEVINLLNKETRRADAAMQKPAVGEKCPCCGQIMKGNMDASEKATMQAAFDSEKQTLLAQLDAAKADKKKAEDSLQALEKDLPARAAAIAKDRADALAVAQAVLPEADLQKLTNADSAAVREAVIKAKYPTISLDGKDASYLAGLFVSVQESVKANGTRAAAQNRAASVPAISADGREKGLPALTAENFDGSMSGAQAAQARMAERNRNAHKTPALAFGNAKA